MTSGFKTVAVILSALLLIAAGLFWWWKADLVLQTADTASLNRLAVISASKPAIAVLPFAADGDSHTIDAYFIDGMTIAINRNLSILSGLFVIARGSSFAYGRQPDIDIKQIADELDVSYILRGRAEMSTGGDIVVDVTLIDAENEQTIWQEVYQRPLTEIFQLQGDIAIAVANRLGITPDEQEERLIRRRPTANLDAYDVFLRGQALYSHTSKETSLSAQALFGEAVELDPQFADAISSLALTYADAAFMGWSDAPETSLEQAQALAEQAASIDDSLAQTNWALSYAYLSRKQHAQSIDIVEKAIELDPNYADAYGLLAFILNYAGRPELGSRLVGKAIRLNPHASAGYFYVLGQAYYLLGRYEEAIEALTVSLERNHSNLFTHLYLAASYSRLEQYDEAEWVSTEILSIFPAFTLQAWVRSQPYRAQDQIEQLSQDLQQAGLR